MTAQDLCPKTMKGFHILLLQYLVAAVIVGLSGYTLAAFPEWKEVRFTVAAGAWLMVSHYMTLTVGDKFWVWNPMTICALTWAMFLAVWIALADNIGHDNFAYCRAGPGGGHIHTNPCNTLYAAFALSIFEWVLLSVSLAHGVDLLRKGRANTKSENV